MSISLFHFIFKCANIVQLVDLLQFQDCLFAHCIKTNIISLETKLNCYITCKQNIHLWTGRSDLDGIWIDVELGSPSNRDLSCSKKWCPWPSRTAPATVLRLLHLLYNYRKRILSNNLFCHEVF
jgi:hypothetical protein